MKPKKVEKIELVDTKLLERLRMQNDQNERPEAVGIHRLIKNDFFLGLLLLTFINALIFVYYQISKQSWISAEEATREFSVFADRVPSALNAKVIINLQGKFYTKQSPEFDVATRSLGLNQENFIDSGSGVIYQVPRDSQNNER